MSSSCSWLKQKYPVRDNDDKVERGQESLLDDDSMGASECTVAADQPLQSAGMPWEKHWRQAHGSWTSTALRAVNRQLMCLLWHGGPGWWNPTAS